MLQKKRGHLTKNEEQCEIGDAKYGLKRKEKVEILAHGYFEKRGNQLKRGTLTPLQLERFLSCI